MKTLTFESPEEGIALITLNRPDRHNAIDPPTDKLLGEVFAAAEADKSIRCIVVTGAGATFCAGADITTMLPYLKSGIQSGNDVPQFGGITHWPMTTKPVIAAINGAALGGGLEIALACDLRIASRTATFGLPEITVGVLAGGGGCTRLPRDISSAVAAEMILTGKPIDAGRALVLGLVSDVADPDELMPKALKLASVIAARAPLAVAACTQLLRRQRYEELRTQLLEERSQFAKIICSNDAAEGIAAFSQKRAPKYNGT